MTLTERAKYTKLYLNKISKKYNLTQLLELQQCKQTNPKAYAEYLAFSEQRKQTNPKAYAEYLAFSEQCKQTNPKAYAEYLAFSEQCKAEAKAEMGITEEGV